MDDSRLETVRVVLAVLRPICEEIDQLFLSEEQAMADRPDNLCSVGEHRRDAYGNLERALDGLQGAILELEELVRVSDTPKHYEHNA